MSQIDNNLLDELLQQELPNKEDKMGLTLVAEKDRSLKFGVVGVGQCGSRLAELFYKYGYSAGVINTALQDLAYIEVPQRKKLYLDLGLAGAGKDLNRGEEAILTHRDTIVKFLDTEVTADTEMLFLCISGGGGTGAGSVIPMVEILASFGRPVGVIYVLPLNTDDATAKKNSLTTLAKLAKMASTDAISTLIVVDNAKIESLFADLSTAEFWKTANKAIVQPLHLFNTLTNQPSAFTSLDAADWGKILAYGDCSIYGMVEVENYLEETALAEAVLKSLDANMLASSFDLKQAKIGGVLVVGSQEALEKTPSTYINYMYHMINEKTDSASIYKGVYAMNMDKDVIRVYSFFSGLGLPLERINALKAESAVQEAKAEEKMKSRAITMAFDLGEKTANTAAEIHKKIQNKNSGFNRLAGQVGIVDKRKKQ